MAVCSVVYEPKKETNETEEEALESEDEEGENDLSDDDEDYSNWNEEVNGDVGTPEEAADLKSAITKVNKIVNKFRKSPKLWEKLLEMTPNELPDKKAKGLLKQCKTRW